MIGEELRKSYWKTVAGTRKARRISGPVIEKTEEKWKQYDEDVVKEALQIHISRCRGMKENYTLGIMRNLQRQKENGSGAKQKSEFSQYEQRTYDYKELERELLG